MKLRKKVSKVSPFLLTLTAATGLAGSSLRWYDATQALAAAPCAEQAPAAFSFVNEADHPITLTRVRSSCGCTVAALDKTVYQPGVFSWQVLFGDAYEVRRRASVMTWIWIIAIILIFIVPGVAAAGAWRMGVIVGGAVSRRWFRR